MTGFLFVLLLIAYVLGFIVWNNVNDTIQKLKAQNINLNERLKRLEGGQYQLSVSEKKEVPETVPDNALEPIKSAAMIQSETALKAPIPDSIDEPADIPELISSGTTERKADWSPVIETVSPAKSSLEDKIGGQWTVWVGGIALLLGAVLLIRYSIEAGFFGPGARIIMSYIMGAILLGCGEWLRRSDAKLPDKVVEASKAISAHIPIPTLLSAIGIFTWLGATYAAHELHGFISATVASLGLGAISLGALALSLRQGQWLALIGLLASFATPLLIENEAPSLTGLYGYLLIIGAAALVLSRWKDWGWLGLGVVAGWLGWSAFSLRTEFSVTHQMIWLGFLAIGFITTVYLASRSKAGGFDFASPTQWKVIPGLALLWSMIAAILALPVLTDFMSTISAENFSGTISTPTILDYFQIFSTVGLLGAAGLIFKRQSAHIIFGAILASICLMHAYTISSHIVLGLLSAVLIIVMIWYSFQIRVNQSWGLFRRPGFWGVMASILAILSPVIPLQFTDLVSDVQYGIWLGLYVILFGGVAVYFRQFENRVLIRIYTCAAMVAYFFAAAYLTDTALEFNLMSLFGAVLFAGATLYLRLPGARMSAFALVALAVFPVLNGSNISERLILNSLWAYLAVPALILGGLSYLLRRQDRNDKVTDFLEAAALALFALFIVFQIRHLSNGGEVYADKFGFGELGLQIATGLCLTLAGLSPRFKGNEIFAGFAQIVSIAMLAMYLILGLILLSPLFNGGQSVSGNFIFNTLTIGFLVPTLLLALCAWLSKGQREPGYVYALSVLSLLGGLSWITAQIRFGFQGAKIAMGEVRFGNVELYTISAAWLIIGIVLLAAGIKWRALSLRIASAVIIVLTVLKTFLVDMAGLEGILRPLSFVGLGIVLIVIGRAYQKYWLTGNLRSAAHSDQSDEA